MLGVDLVPGAVAEPGDELCSDVVGDDLAELGIKPEQFLITALTLALLDVSVLTRARSHRSPSRAAMTLSPQTDDLESADQGVERQTLSRRVAAASFR